MSGGRQSASGHLRAAFERRPRPATLDAVADVDARGVLRRIVQAAREVSDASYAALGVVGKDRAIVDLIADGLSDEEIARIGRYPHAHGILGGLLDDPRPMRLRRIGDHPAARELPPDHPTMTSFLGVPVHVHDRVFGLLYLADKRSTEEFTEADERAVAALGSAAGVAVENARLYGLSQRRGRWLEASADITRMLLERADRDAALRAVTRRARELSGSDAAGVLLADDSDDLVVHETDGDAIYDLRDRIARSDDPALARVLREGLPTTVGDLRTLFDLDERTASPPPRPALLVPFRSSSNATGILLVVEPTPPPSPEDEYMLQTFADQAAIALDLAQARSDGEMVVVLEDRDRIARDLHDVVIQRLFATGLMLQGAHRLALQSDARERIETAVDELDITIRDLRSAIFELHRRAPMSLRSELSGLISDYATVLGFPPRLNTYGPLNSVIHSELRSQVLAVLREALSNVAKHAQASSVEMTVTASDQEVIAQVADNGVGINHPVRESGLRNIRERAETLGGSVVVEHAEPRGTVVRWRVPMNAPRVS
jgi:signal transduction histidine kinase